MIIRNSRYKLSSMYYISRVTTKKEEGEGANLIYRNTRIGNYWLASGRPFLRTFFANKMLK